MRYSPLLPLAALLCAAPLAADETRPPSPAPAPVSAATPSGKTVWDVWYTVTVNGKVPYEYYNEKVESRGGRYFFQFALKRLEEGFLNQEQLGAEAENDSDLTPDFYNFHSTYRSTETLIDGTVKDGKSFTIKVKRGGNDLPAVTRVLPRKTFFAQFFPLWLGHRLAELKTTRSVAFTTVLEDDVDGGFAPLSGRVTLEKPDETANRSHTQKLQVELGGQKMMWWVEPSGEAFRVERPAQGLVVQRVDKQTALGFLNEP